MSERREPIRPDDRNDLDTEQLLSEWFEAEAPTREPAVLAPNVIARTALTRRRSRFLVRDWWRDLFRDDQRPSLKPALGAGAIVLVLLLAGVASLLPPAEIEQPVVDYPADAIVVSMEDVQSTIAAAIAEAEEGDFVVIMPGEYEENLVLDKDITLMGGGDRDSIVLRPADPDQPILSIDGADATVSGFTITGPGSSVTVLAGAPLIDDMVFREVGDQWWTYTGSGWDGYDEAAPSILVELFAEPTIQNSRFDGGGEIDIRDSSTAFILNNTLTNGAAIFLNDASGETIVRDNSITDSGLFSIEITSATDLLVEGNVIDQSLPGIGIQAIGLTGTIRDNVIRGPNVGIQLIDGASPEITGNVIDASGTAFEVHEGVSPTVRDNEICGENAIMAVMRGAEPLDLSDNEVCDAPLVYGE
ncbi:MAG: right-handed parallel beta-helix repeat-containing protein [Chloroflexota bacterium]